MKSTYLDLFHLHMSTIQSMDDGHVLTLEERRVRRLLHFHFFMKALIYDEVNMDYNEPLKWKYNIHEQTSRLADMSNSNTDMNNAFNKQMRDFQKENTILKKVDEVFKPDKIIIPGASAEEIAKEERIRDWRFIRTQARLNRLILALANPHLMP